MVIGMPQLPFSATDLIRVRQCRHGIMLYPHKDAYVGRSLDIYGEFSEGEAQAFRSLIKPGDFALDVGANIGAHTLTLAELVGKQGRVWAFEPQRPLFQMLCANVALNSIQNVCTFEVALSSEAEVLAVPETDYEMSNNFGGISLVPFEDAKDAPVTTRALDSYEPPAPSFIKIDVEGMELDVLQGAEKTIHNFKPVLYVENDRKGKSPALIRWLWDHGYVLWWHTPPLFSPFNFAQQNDNVFGNVVSCNMLCLPEGDKRKVTGLRHVTSEHEWVLG